MFRRLLILVVALTAVAGPSHAAENPTVVIVPLHGVTWEMLESVDLPNIESLVASGSSAAVSVRTGNGRSNPARGYATLGAGQRAVVPNEPIADSGYEAAERVSGANALAAMFQRTGVKVDAEVVHLGAPDISALQEDADYGAVLGALGDAVHLVGGKTGIVSAADNAIDPEPEDVRAAGTLAVMDSSAAVDHGTLRGLLEAAPRRPWGVKVDQKLFAEAVGEEIGRSDVILADPGETSRAREFGQYATADRADALMRQALKETDDAIARIKSLLSDDDTLILLGVSSVASTSRDELTPMVMAGPGVATGGVLSSPSTRQPGIVTLIDVAPTIVARMGGERAPSMGGRPITSSHTGTEVGEYLSNLSVQSAFSARFALSIYYYFVIAVVLLTALAFPAFRLNNAAARRAVSVLARMILAFPLATLLVHAPRLTNVPEVLAHLAVWGATLGIALLSFVVPGPRWAAGVVILLATATAYAVDLAGFGGALQLNGVFGASPVVGGRFYGLVNAAFAILLGASVLGLLGAAELLGRKRVPWWAVLGMGGTVLLIGAPAWGSNFGGLLTAAVTVVVTLWLARYGRISIRALAIAGVVAVVLAAGLAILDSTRDVASQTHLGRLVDDISAGGLGEAWLIIQRKLGAAFATLKYTRWTYAIPVCVAILALLLHRPRGPLASDLPRRKLLTAALWGLLVAAVVGFSVNDSGIVIPAMLVGMVVPFLILLALDAVSPRRAVSQ